MVSCSRIWTSCFLITGLFLLSACGQEGVAPGLLVEGFDYSACDELITQDTDNTTFQGLLQDGASASDPFTVCIEENVTIGSTGTQVAVNKTNLLIIGVSQTTSVVNGLSLSVSNPTLYVRNLKLVPTTSGMEPNTCFKSISSSGSSTFLFDKVICSAPSAHTSMDESAFVFAGTSTAIINVTVSNSVITSSRYGITTIAINGGTLTSTLTNNTLTVNGAAIRHIEHSNSVGVVNIGGNTMKFNGAGGAMENTAIFVFGHTGGTLTVNDTSGSQKNFACKVAGSVGTFSGVYSIGSHSGTVIAGNFTAAGTQNGGDTIGNCP